MFAIAIDLGGTKMQGCLIDENGRIRLSRRIPTGVGGGKKAIIKNIVGMVDFLKKSKENRIAGVGVSLPGIVNDQGVVVFGGGSLSCLEGENLKKQIEKRTGFQVFLENDAKCFALAEATYGAGKGCGVVVGIIWGTGIGGALVVGRKVFRGSIGGAGEIGHIIVNSNLKSGPECGCGQRGCLEMMASGKNIARRYIGYGGKIRNPDVPLVFHSNEKAAKKAISEAINYMGLGLSIVVNMYNPKIIIIGGGVSKLPDSVYSKLRKEVKKYALPTLTRGLEIVRHKISDDAGVIGAAAMVFNR
jgi:glucokinase